MHQSGTKTTYKDYGKSSSLLAVTKSDLLALLHANPTQKWVVWGVPVVHRDLLRRAVFHFQLSFRHHSWGEGPEKAGADELGC